MKAVWITKAGRPEEALEVRETPEPEPGPGEVRIRVRAAGLSFAELMTRLGLYQDAPKLPSVLGYEAAGVVDALGKGVEEPAVGTRVLAACSFGAQAEAVCVPVAQALPMPDEMGFEEAAALPVNYLTAHHMLFQVAALRPGDRVLVHQAAGGVGTALLQLCRTVDDTVVFGTASAAKHDAIREEGCAHPIDYRSRNYAREVRRLTRGEGVDVVFDALGGRDWRTGYQLLRPAGRLVAYGFSNLATERRRNPLRLLSQGVSAPFFSPLSLMNNNRSVSGVHMGRMWDRQDLLAPQMDRLLELYAKGAITPRIDSVVPFAEVARAHHRVQRRQNVGKVILVP
ncbi:alcohol dehydrogenase [Streptomyces sp. AJS327]|uniref:synaptic vesicle VAT-1 family membrane protein n=1 Tax=Streptomyces sp. AJS327 TaxID=2545265 RepID=UPI0015DE7BF2|nr:medium chain dehydrogenase/reductase family protein [Streptomyces sp. AJS327]MBA0051967.1 alcohol dehydrogenase [Streptomyces sp. AJS327]